MIMHITVLEKIKQYNIIKIVLEQNYLSVYYN